MSMCVVRMEMPENCTCCPMCFTADVQGYHWCAALEQEVEEGMSRPKECPITCSLPEGHGRLVDADALMEIIRAHDYPLTDYFNSADNGMFTIGIQQAVDEVPAIVPADAERSET